MINTVELGIPNDFEAEQAVLGSVIYDNNILIDILSLITPTSFYTPANQYVFRAMLELQNSNRPIDELLIGDELKILNQLEEVGGYSYLASLVDCTPSSGNIIYYAKIIRDHALLRQIITVTTDAAKKSRNPELKAFDVLDDLEEKISVIRSHTDDATKEVKHVFKKSFERLEKISENKGEVPGIRTGFPDIDKILGGLQPSDLVILGARPSMGKTALALDLIRYAATRDNFPGYDLFVSLEMSMEQLGMRLLAQEGRVDTSKLRTGDLDQGEWDKLAMATDVLSDANILINDSTFDLNGIINLIKQKHKKYGLKRVIIDYLQLITGDINKPREREVADISRSFKLLAKQLDINIILLCQLNRELEKRSDKRPMMSDLRESGSLEQDADVIAFIYRDEQYNEETTDKGIAEILFKKHRNGPTGVVKLAYIGKYTRFANYSER